MSQHRPLFKHIRNHDALFGELALIRNEYANSMGLCRHDYHKTPKFITADGSRLSIEPERSIVVTDYKVLTGVKGILQQQIRGFEVVERSDIGFRYPTAAIAGLDAPFIKRFRSEFFHNVGEHRNIFRPINLSYGIKSRGKDDNRQEYEVWVPNDNLDQDPSPLFIDKYGEDLPDEVRDFATQSPLVYGWMGVKRGAFEAIYQNKAVMGDIAINIGLSVDAYNIGAKPDLSFSPLAGSSIALSNAELEWEVMGFYAPRGMHPDHDQIWAAIAHSLEAIGEPMSEIFAGHIVPINQSKTERILHTVAEQISLEQIQQWALKPWEFLQSTSHRTKANDNSRNVNLLGRLNRLFYQEDKPLPSLKEIHNLIA